MAASPMHDSDRCEICGPYRRRDAYRAGVRAAEAATDQALRDEALADAKK